MMPSGYPGTRIGYTEMRERANELKRAARARDPQKHRDQNRAWNLANPEKAADTHRLVSYGMRPGEYAAMSAAQGGGCAACGEVTALAVDHNHETGVVRGLLCQPCNRSAGQVGDSPERLRLIADYLERTCPPCG